MKPRAQCNPSIGGSGRACRMERSCRLESGAFASWPNATAASDKTTHSTNIFSFMVWILSKVSETFRVGATLHSTLWSARHYVSRDRGGQYRTSLIDTLY